MPNTIGRIDGCHIRIHAPRDKRSKMFQSIVLFAVCNAKLEFTYIFRFALVWWFYNTFRTVCISFLYYYVRVKFFGGILNHFCRKKIFDTSYTCVVVCFHYGWSCDG
ncbi:unnamed protein product [Macrosiphum euphorbiae]|uniref:DDE Tnp4 domain-containing protein n=1 Tax=Macrosiphum euphorbiae TaxID=13131 RepID=A0AAV0WQQ9_9HEMI|nr:unnamed protein product [Macrosiphum euphorbiae]